MRKETWVKIAIGLLVVVILGVCYTVQSCNDEETTTKVVFSTDSTDVFLEETEDSQIVCYITGAVVSPGVYSLSEDARICDLVEEAGGFTEDADRISINLAELLYDGAHIHVYAIGEYDSDENSDTKININSCERDDLLSLPGIGEKKADAIITYRVQNGRFSSIEDIMNVSGIGQAMFEEIKEYIKVQ